MDLELRKAFHDRIAKLHDDVGAIVETVAGSVDAATSALLAHDASAGLAVAALDADIDVAYQSVEREVLDCLALQAPVARDLRFLLATMRVAQAGERCGDLVASIGRRAARVEATCLTPELRLLIAAMSAAAIRMLEAAARAYAVLDDTLALDIVASDDELDALHARFLHELYDVTEGSARDLVELGLVGRFYERLGDHAVVIAERVRFVVSGDMEAADADERGG